MKRKLRGSLCLMFGTVIWGSAFIAQSAGMDYIGPFTFQTLRCALAVVFLSALSVLFELKNFNLSRFLGKWLDIRLWKTGAVCGAALFVASGLQQVGLQFTTAGKAGFITAMYIILVPVLGVFLGKKPPISAWVGVLIAALGLYLLCCAGASQINRGDIYLLICALAFAVQITLIDRFADGLDGIRLNCVQSLVCAILSSVMMGTTETVQVSAILACWVPLCYAGILSMGVAYSLQIIGQRDLEPTAASLIMSLESVFAALFGWLLLGERMRVSELLGCVLVFCAVLIPLLKPAKKRHD